MRRNATGQFVSAQLVALADGSAVTSGSTSVFVCKDGGTQTTGSGTVTHEGNGQWSYACTQSDTDAQQVAFTFANSLAVAQCVNVFPVAKDSSGNVTPTATNADGNAIPTETTLARITQGRSQVLYVSPSGNNSNSGTTPALAKLTITSAKSAASAGALIVVLPGTYTSDTNILKDGVDYHFVPGAVVDFQDASPASKHMLSDADGAIRCKVTGAGQFIRSVVDNSINLIHVVNADSRVDIEAAELGRDENDIHDHAIYVTAGTVDIRIPRIDTLAMASGRAIEIAGGTVRFHGETLVGDGIDISGGADVTTFGRITSSNIGVYLRGTGLLFRAYGDITSASEAVFASSATGIAIFDGIALRRTTNTDSPVRAESNITTALKLVFRRCVILGSHANAIKGDAGATVNAIIDEHTTMEGTVGANATVSYATANSNIDAKVTATRAGYLDAAISSRSTLDAAGIRTAIGLASANLDTQLSGIDTAIGEIEGGSGGAGSGNVAVNHNYGGADTYRVVDSNGSGIDEVTVNAYEASAYTSNPLTAPIVAQVYTGSDGRWATTMMLDAGSYTLKFSKPGTIQDQTASLTVT